MLDLGAHLAEPTIAGTLPGRQPSKATQELIAAIKPGQLGPSPRTEDLRNPQDPGSGQAVARPEAPWLGATLRGPRTKLMLSVAGFEVSATKAEQRYLVEGFRRELIACLVERIVLRMSRTAGHRRPRFRP